VTDSNGNSVTTSDGKAVFQFTDNNGNDVLGTIADDGETITALTDEEQIYVDAKTGKKKYAQIDASTSTFTNTTTVPVDGKYELQAVYLDNTDPQEQATDADGNLIYAIETKDATNGNTAYIYGTIAPIETTNGGDESPFYKFTKVTGNYAITGATTVATTTAATLVKVESEINDDAYSANDDPLIYNVKDSDGNAVKTYEGDTVYAIYQNDGQGNLTKILGTVVQNANDPFSFEFTELSEEDQMYVEAASGYKKYTTNGEELVSVNIKDANGDAGEQATYQGKKVYAVQTGTDAAGAATYKYGYIDNVDSEPYYNFTELPEAYQDSYAVDTAVAGDPNIKMRSVTTKDSDVFTYDEIGGEYRQKNDFDVNNLNQYWDENLFSAEDGVSTVGVTAKYIAVSDAWMQSSTDVTNTRSFSSTGDDKSGDNSNILKMIQLFDNSTSFNTGKSNITLFTGGYESFLSTVGDTVALDVNTSNTRLDSYDNVLTSIDSDRMSVSGVNIDEEAVDIYQYQRAYEAASRVMTALDELLDKLINSTGTVGR
jgi:flagellar hook-associated protein FlgK